jgi:glutathione S-transferase
LALDRITVELQRSGYLVGDRFTVADLTAPAIFSPLVMPKKFQWPFLERPEVPWRFARIAVGAPRVSAGIAEIYLRHGGSSAEVPA